MKTVSVFEGKNKFSEIVAEAAAGEPQLITKNGKETVVMISYTDYKKLKEQKESLSSFLLKSPWRGADIDLSRSKDMGRPAPDFSGKDHE